MHRLFATIILLVSCGQHRPGTYSDRDLDPSSIGEKLSLVQLTQSAAAHEFSTGSLLVWNPRISDEKVRQVLEANAARREIQRQMLEERSRNIINAGGGDLLRLRTEARTLETELHRQYSSLRQQRAEIWFDQQIDALSGNSSPERSRMMWSTYCQAKIWERALDQSLIEWSFRRRPSPLVLCEGVYRQLGLFEYGGSSRCSESDVAKNYFDCLWTDGVLKTDLFKNYRWGNDPIAAEKILATDADLIRQNIIWDPTLKTKFLQQKKLKILTMQAGETPLYEIGPVEKTELPEFGDDSVFSIIFNIENRKKRFFAVDAAGLELSQMMTSDLTMIARPSTAISIHEYWFNLPHAEGDSSQLMMPAPADISRAEGRFSELMRASDPEAESRLDEIKLAIERKRATLRPRLERLISGDCQSQRASLMCEEQAAQLRAIELAREAEVGQALFGNLALRIVSQQDGRVCVELKFDASRPASQTICSMPQMERGNGLEIDDHQAALRFNFRLNDDASDQVLLGQTRASQIESKSVHYNDMLTAEWIGPRIHFELFLRSWQDHADGRELSKYLIGRVWAEADTAERMWLGAVFLRESDPASQADWERIVEAISMEEK